MLLQPSLKEWSIAVDALTQGQTVLLLRKGGIREIAGRFEVPHQTVWLYPTYEHQKPHLLKPQWAEQVTAVAPGWHPTQVMIRAWAKIVHVWTVRSQGAMEAVLPFHIWNERFATERFRWKPSQPLHLLILRTYRLATPIAIDWQPSYGGCRSWLTLEKSLDTAKSHAVLEQQSFDQVVQQIQQQIGRVEAPS